MCFPEENVGSERTSSRIFVPLSKRTKTFRDLVHSDSTKVGQDAELIVEDLAPRVRKINIFINER